MCVRACVCVIFEKHMYVFTYASLLEYAWLFFLFCFVSVCTNMGLHYAISHIVYYEFLRVLVTFLSGRLAATCVLLTTIQNESGDVEDIRRFAYRQD